MSSNQGTIKGFSTHKLARSLNPKEFHLILYPTEQCNFRCVYCYEDFEIGKMPTWLVDATNTLIAKRIPDLDRLSLSWFGGEPLLAKDIVFEMAEKALKLGEEHGCRVIGDMTTNGLLLDVKTLTRLVELEQRYFQISIDGDKESHDKTRVTRSGKGSFDKIWGRLMDAAQTDLNFHITLRVHVTDLNQTSVEDFCRRYDETLADDKRFTLFFKAIKDLGGNNPEHVKQLISKRSATAYVEELVQRYAGNTHNDKRKDNYICYAGKPNSLGIRADGRLNKCTVALSDDRNTVGKINEDGTLTIDNQNFSTWIKGFTTLDSWQMGCPLSYMNHHTPVGDIPLKKVG